jgi:hypothetical protein
MISPHPIQRANECAQDVERDNDVASIVPNVLIASASASAGVPPQPENWLGEAPRQLVATATIPTLLFVYLHLYIATSPPVSGQAVLREAIDN